MRPGRRAALFGVAAAMLAGCGRRAMGEQTSAGAGPLPPLKDVARFPVGTALQTGELGDPALGALVRREFSQVTPEWEMKMERILGDDGALRFDAADRIAAFCRDGDLKLHATTLVWYAQRPARFERLAGDRAAFEKALSDYAGAVMGRYRGLARGWDVVNEAVAEEGDGYRGGVWEEGLGPDFAWIAFEIARAADPDARLFLNDYNLEILPTKLDAFQRLLERLLRAGAPVTGIGTQSHLSADLPPGVPGRAIRSLARFGLPIHVSELDISLKAPALALASTGARLQAQARVAAEIAEAFMALPASQRYAFTLWGVRDRDSWLTHQAGGAGDAPLLFDDAGRPKSALGAVERAFRG